MRVIGVDPGKSGGIAVLESGVVVAVTKLDATEVDVREFLEEHDGGVAYLEQVASMPGQGVSSTFKFGQSYGFLRGLLVAMRIPFETVTPSKWQGAMRCRTGGDKNVTKSRAQELYPNVTVTHAIADALLIATYGHRLRSGTL